MGTIIALSVGGMDIDECKNFVGTDHGSLFQESDRKRIRSDQVNYDYYEDPNDPDLAAMEIGFVKPLRDVVQRLELLGYTHESIRVEYLRAAENAAEQNREYNADLGADDDEQSEPTTFLTFENFYKFVSKQTISDLNDDFVEGFGPERDKEIQGRIFGTGIHQNVPLNLLYDRPAWSERSYFCSLLDFLDPYSVAWLLGQNPDNLDQMVTWQYGPLVNNGWANESEFVACPGRRATFLIATEGSSDTKILKHAIELLRPEISDFFRFIDVEEGHPFSGTGNLHKFAEGLAKIDVQNQTIFLYDNDAEGHATYKRTSALKLPDNMRVQILPDLNCFEEFAALGPSGKSFDNINRRAAAIECYLDLEQSGLPPPVVRWSNYIPGTDSYQGSLDGKTQFAKRFFKLKPETVGALDYDTSKIAAVLDVIVSECSNLAGTMRAKRYQR